VLFFLVYLLLRRFARLVMGGSAAAGLEVENGVLRHQLRVLQRTAKRPELQRRERLILAVASGLLPRERWSAFVVSPQTVVAVAARVGAALVDVSAPAGRPAAA
jgi:hypothetical protein